MSLPVIDSICDYANKYNKSLMLIASRNQIECKELGGGYVNNFNTDEYVKYVKIKDKNNKVALCRDHTGPYLSDSEKSNSLKDSLKKTKISIQNDIRAGFDFIHIDTSMCKRKYEIAEELIDYALEKANSLRKKIFFEFGTEEHGVEVAYSKFKEDINFASRFKEIKFVVGQTGSLCKEIYQVGGYNFSMVKKMVTLAAKKNILLKEHNGDYLSKSDLLLRKKSQLGSLNVAPQFGVEHTKTIHYLSNIYDEINIFEKFFKYVISKNKWKKWAYGKTPNQVKFLCSAHYFFETEEYKNLVYRLEKKVNINLKIKNNIENLINHYYQNL
tara:strand:- start:17920 stop:18903 length:984 start_codon:yes stop_codon:yes gene_type:complete